MKFDRKRTPSDRDVNVTITINWHFCRDAEEVRWYFEDNPDETDDDYDNRLRENVEQAVNSIAGRVDNTLYGDYDIDYTVDIISGVFEKGDGV